MKVRREGGWGVFIGGYHVGCHPQKHHWKTSWDTIKYKYIYIYIYIYIKSGILLLFKFLA